MDIANYNNYIKQLYNSNNSYNNNDLHYLFDNNYKKIIRLIPHILNVKNKAIAKVNGSPDLHLWIDKICPYTIFCTLSHKFDIDNKIIKKPDIKIKIYLDVKTVEVISVCQKEIINSQHPYINKCSDADIVWDLNILLTRWLEYCLDKNYKWL